MLRRRLDGERQLLKGMAPGWRRDVQWRIAKATVALMKAPLFLQGRRQLIPAGSRGCDAACEERCGGPGNREDLRVQDRVGRG